MSKRIGGLKAESKKALPLVEKIAPSPVKVEAVEVKDKVEDKAENKAKSKSKKNK